MAKKKELEARIKELEEQQGATTTEAETAEEATLKEESKPAKPKKAAEPAKEPEPVEPEPAHEEPRGPVVLGSIHDSPTEPEAEPEADVSVTAEKLRKKVQAMRDYAEEKEKSFAKKRQKFEDEIAALEAEADDLEKAEVEAMEKAEAEAKLKAEAEAKAKAEAEAAQRAEKEVKAKRAAALQAAINDSEKPKVGKAYKWWDYNTRTWNLTRNFWAANQSSDIWEVVFVWYQDGEIVRLLTDEEIKKYCP